LKVLLSLRTLLLSSQATLAENLDGASIDHSN
jgi:hypothetical protein